jgi:hypothetical protein
VALLAPLSAPRHTLRGVTTAAYERQPGRHTHTDICTHPICLTNRLYCL